MQSYGKIDPYVQAQYDRQTNSRRRWIIIGVALTILVLAIVAISVGVSRSKSGGENDEAGVSSDSLSTGSKAIEVACSTTLFPDVCIEELSAYPGALSASPRELVDIAVKIALDHTQIVLTLAHNLSSETGPLNETSAIVDCLEMMDIWQDQLNRSIAQLEDLTLENLVNELYNVKVWMSSSLTYQSTCLDGFSDVPATQIGARTTLMENSLADLFKVIVVATGLVGSLSNLGKDISSWGTKPQFRRRRLLEDFGEAEFVDGISRWSLLEGFNKVGSDVMSRRSLLEDFNKVNSDGITRRSLLEDFNKGDDSNGIRRWSLLEDFDKVGSDGIPHWVSASDRKLLQSPGPGEAPQSSLTYDAVVSKDLLPKEYSTIQSAVDDIPSSRPNGRWTIYIKAGVYTETVRLTKSHKFVTFIGDGINKTIITGHRNVYRQGYTTFNTATVAVVGESFLARGITFRNTAGPEGHQAVALRAGADFMIFDSCSFEGFQDTLYPHTGRQFYYNCDIYGTVDYIFGNSVTVFQKCRLYAQQPAKGQQNTFTAQGRQLADEPTGFSFQACTLDATSDLSSSSYTVLTYLGRPWKAYSRTVFVQSTLGSLIQPAGWLAWNSSNPFITTLFYGEYGNIGPGSLTSERVDWPGVHPTMSHAEASAFSVTDFLASSETTWLTSSGLEIIFSVS